jgi:hypothetical protein
MNTYGMVLEGKYDDSALLQLLKKLFSTEIKIITRIAGNKSTLIAKLPAYLASFRLEGRTTHVDKAFAILDADGKDPEELKTKMRRKCEGRNYSFDVKFIVIVQELEAWLLADEEGISRVTVSRSGKHVARVNEDLESIFRPKEKLSNLLIGADVPYTDVVAGEIARESNLDMIGYRCPSFREFRQAVLDC